jgi:tetratricopeptide (TPR) repeat protein
MATINDVTKLLDKMNVSGALDIADNVKDRKKTSEVLTNYAATLGRHTGAYEEIEKILGKAVELDSGNAVAYYNLGCLHTEPELIEKDSSYAYKALGEYRKAVELDGKMIKARYNLALLLAFLGSPEEAWDEYDVLLDLDPEHSDKYDALEGIIKSRLVP